MQRVACGCGLWRSENMRHAEVSVTGARGHSHPNVLVTQWGNYQPITTIRGKRTLAMRAVEKSTTRTIAGELILRIPGIRHNPSSITTAL